MKSEETRSSRGGRRAVVAAFASILLASCATSGDDAVFGFSPSEHSALTTQTAGNFAGRAVNASREASAGAIGEFITDEDDPALPEAVAEAPSLRPVSREEAEAIAQAQAADRQAVAEAPAAVEQPATEPQAVAAAQQPVEEQRETDGQQATQFIENAPAAQDVALASEEPRKRGFLASFFGAQPARAAPAQQQAARPLIATPTAQASAAAPATPVVQLASTGPAATPLIPRAGGESPLPGVRQNALFEISRRSGLDDDSDIDLHEGSEIPYRVASAAGLARLAPNGLMKQTEHVDVACLKPSLVRVLKTIERHYGRQVIVTSGYRDQERNRRARGARNSLHMYCAAADVQVEGVSKWDLAQFVRSMPGRGGVGTYCHTESVHIDVGPERDWNWRCRRRK